MSKADANQNEVSSILSDAVLETIAAGLSEPVARFSAEKLLEDLEKSGFKLPALPGARESFVSSITGAMILLDYQPQTDPTTPSAV